MNNINVFETAVLRMVQTAINNNHNSVGIKINSTDGDKMAVAIGVFYLEDIDSFSIVYATTRKDTLVDETIKANLSTIYNLFRMQHNLFQGKLQPIFVKNINEANKMMAKEAVEVLKDNNIEYNIAM